MSFSTDSDYCPFFPEQEDKGFDKSLFERQMSVLRGQVRYIFSCNNFQSLKHDYKKIEARPTGSHSILLTLTENFPNILKFVPVGLATNLVK